MDKGLHIFAEPVVVAELQWTVAQLTHSALEHGQDVECVGGALDSNPVLILYLDRQPANDTWPMHAPEFSSEDRFSVAVGSRATKARGWLLVNAIMIDRVTKSNKW